MIVDLKKVKQAFEGEVYFFSYAIEVSDIYCFIGNDYINIKDFIDY